ncbi:hypothetical protein G5V57_27550 [Nordella sp. HKS 07]|uniref:hypothetical protein n=1 Tax=Nordella sp. HKS 07 TaxID=2712222 RepID=UPI0013E1EB62|nr:hypothetical protein [Nordella sp. HKS 07]QIG51147.1 hypothetical protein G5V57_27550 [Nordella sp. HKS 07]
MGGLIHVVMFVGALTAYIAWSIAGLSALSVARLAPRGEKLSSYFELGRWRFATLETRLGAAVTPHLVRYRRAFLVFLAAICAMIVLALSTLFLKPA